jgi:transcriptional regulator with XRE-family HTH domain
MNIGTNIKNIRELKNLSQEYIAGELGISQPSYARIETGAAIPKIDRLQRIADVLEVDLSTLLSTTNIFNVSFNAAVHQSGYNVSNHGDNILDIETLRKIIQEELKKM